MEIKLGGRYKDFDAFWAEKRKEPVCFKAKGVTVELPPSLPAITVIEIMRVAREYGMGEIPPAELFQIAIGVIGKPKVDELCAHGLSVDELGDLVQWVISTYSGEAEEATPGNPPARRGRNKTSSAGGQS